jgi:uncharacterized repeat protein (TIGR02543 family)
LSTQLKRVFSLFAVLALVLSSIVAVNVSVQEVSADEVPFSTAPVNCFDGTDQATQGGKCGGINHLDQEGFALEVTTTEANETVSIPVGADKESYAWQIEWENGVTESKSGTGGEGKTIKHIYDATGTHTVKITPKDNVEQGWLDAFGGFQKEDTYITKILASFSILSRTPSKGFSSVFRAFHAVKNLPSNLFASIDTSEVTDFRYMFESTFYSYAHNSTSATIPAGLFSSLNTSNGTDFSYMFNSTFYYYAHNSTSATIPAGLFSSLNTSNGTNFSHMFSYTFYYYARNSTTATIPANLFSSLNATNGTNFSYMFSSTFNSYADNSTSATIPAGLFSSLNTANGTDFSGMFYNTFNNYAQSSKSATIPANLFSSLNTTNGTDFSSMFGGTFYSYADNSTSATIPTGLFSSLNTANGTDFSYMFYRTFSFYASNSISGTIPAGLFSSLNTAKGTNFSYMFSSTFSFYADNPTSGTIPANLFSSLNTTNGTDFSSMFGGTFYSYAQSSKSATIPAGLFSSLNTANGTDFSSMFSNTFHSYAYNSKCALIPEGLFDIIDTTKASDITDMYKNTFDGYPDKCDTTPEIPFSTDAVSCFDEIEQTPKVTPTYKTKCGGVNHLDQEGFALEVTTTEVNETVSIPVGGTGDYDWNIDLGDTVTANISGTSADGAVITHEYARAGVYIIKITPKNTPSLGWFDAFGGFSYENRDAANYITKILTSFSKLSRTPSRGFSNAFSYLENVNNLPSNLFASIDTSEVTNFRAMFSSTFYSYAYNSTTATIPANLFSSLNTTNGTDFRAMFSSTFHSYAYNSTVGTIPAGLFSALNTVNGTKFNMMFYWTFAYYARYSTTPTIPIGLFNSLVTINGTDFSEMFHYTFIANASYSTIGTIPEGLFDSVITINGTDFREMFYSTFASYVRKSTEAMIPARLFDSIVTKKATSTYDMYKNTFNGYPGEEVPLSDWDFPNGNTISRTSSNKFSTDAVRCFDGTIPIIQGGKCGGTDHLNQEGFALEVTTTEANETVSIPVGGTGDYDWNIDWGDTVTENKTYIDSEAVIAHKYANAGAYIVKITPNVSEGVTPEIGWFDRFGSFRSSDTYITKILTPFPKLSRTMKDYAFSLTFSGMYNANNLPSNLFASIDTSEITNFRSMFAGTFSFYAYNSTTATIPAELFASLYTENGTDFYYMFHNTFYYYAEHSTSGTIPAGLFSSVNTAKGTNFGGMFLYTFSNFAYDSTVGTIPEGLFDSIDTKNGTYFNYMFTSTFQNYAYNSTVGTIPEGLFDSINTSKSTNTTDMYDHTFDNYATKTVTPTCTITFNTQDGSYVQSQTVNEGATASQPSAPTRDGYTFTGWYTSPSGKIIFNFSTPITASITIYAHWIKDTNPTPTQYTLTFNTQGGSLVPSQTINEGETAKQPTAPTRSGYAFQGWFTTAKGGTKFKFATKIIGNTVIYAQWKAVPKPKPSVTPTPTPIQKLPSVNTGAKTRFTDIGALNTGRQTAIQWMYTYGITTGSGGPNTYKPADKVNRGSMAQFMYKVRGQAKTTKTIPKIVDISNLIADRQKAIRWLASENITVIPTSGKYNPKNIVSRGQMADFLYKLAGTPTYKATKQELNKIKDIKDVKNNPNRQNAIAWLVKNEISILDKNSKYNPNNPVNRGSMAEFIMKLYKLYVK